MYVKKVILMMGNPRTVSSVFNIVKFVTLFNSVINALEIEYQIIVAVLSDIMMLETMTAYNVVMVVKPA